MLRALGPAHPSGATGTRALFAGISNPDLLVGISNPDLRPAALEFGFVGLAAGQTARLNMANVSGLRQVSGVRCSANVAFVDEAGAVLSASRVDLASGASISVDLRASQLPISNRNRAAVRAVVSSISNPDLRPSGISNPDLQPAMCSASFEVADEATGVTIVSQSAIAMEGAEDVQVRSTSKLQDLIEAQRVDRVQVDLDGVPLAGTIQLASLESLATDLEPDDASGDSYHPAANRTPTITFTRAILSPDLADWYKQEVLDPERARKNVTLTFFPPSERSNARLLPLLVATLKMASPVKYDDASIDALSGGHPSESMTITFGSLVFP